MNLNPSNNLKDLVISTFQEILTEDPNFFFTDKLSILTWKSQKIAGALITKIGNRRYLGFLRKDIKGQDYWKYKPLNKNSELEESGSEVPVNQTSSDHLTAQELNHGKSNNNSEPSVNEQSQPNS